MSYASWDIVFNLLVNWDDYFLSTYSEAGQASKHISEHNKDKYLTNSFNVNKS